jgi:hypothetical protein
MGQRINCCVCFCLEQQRRIRMAKVLHPDPLPVIMEDDPIHENPYPFCSDPTCPDKEAGNNEEAIALLNAEVSAGLLTSEEATNIVNGKQVYQAGW